MDDDQIVVVMELNNATVYRDYDGASDDTYMSEGLPEEHAESRPEHSEGTRSTLYVRPGAARLVYHLLTHPRCCLVMISRSGTRHCLPMAHLLLQRAVPPEFGNWIADDAPTPSMVFTAAPGWKGTMPRVWVLDSSGYSTKDMRGVWSRLRASGCGDFNRQNTVIIDNWWGNTSSPENVIEVTHWQAWSGQWLCSREMDDVRGRILDLLESPGASVPARLVLAPACQLSCYAPPVNAPPTGIMPAEPPVKAPPPGIMPAPPVKAPPPGIMPAPPVKARPPPPGLLPLPFGLAHLLPGAR